LLGQLTLTYSFHPSAKQELQEAIDFYAAKASAKIADAFLNEVERVADMLAAHPDYGKPMNEVWRSFPLRRYPYTLIYHERGQDIRIIAVAHQHRKPGYWLSRQ
jgi:plasmid stabilization system protein ParE